MEKEFWHSKWNRNEIGFHLPEANLQLIRFFDSLGLKPGSRILIPLCGKTLDIFWLIEHGYQVVGVELVEMAVQQLFAENGITPEITELGDFKRYRADSLDIIVGDVLHVSSEQIDGIDAIYDRAAYVALPQSMRKRYATHLQKITQSAPQLLITFDYDQAIMNGPPFSIPFEEITEQFGKGYAINKLCCDDMQEGLKGHPAKECVWLLTEKN